MRLHCESLGEQVLDHFDCGSPQLSTWLRDHATNATGHGTRTTVVLDELDGVVGYFEIAPHLVERETLPAGVATGAPIKIPAILLAKLALSKTLHGQGLGAELLVIAIRRVVVAATTAGGKIIVVDAIDDAAARFYRHHDFLPLPNRADRLVMKISTAAKALGEQWP
jgi:GNAT superfamily N-acetyltransferase